MISLMKSLDSSRLGRQSTEIKSDKALRIAIGFLGIALAPFTWLFAQLFGNVTLLPSISAYYHTNAEDFFVGVLFLVGVFQMSYRGHQVIDNVFTWITGILALLIALFPCSPDLNTNEIPCPDILSNGIGIFNLSPEVSDRIHLSVATSFFILISVYLLVFFRRSKDTPSIEKKRKNLVFTVCGYGMISILVVLFAMFSFNRDFFHYPGRLFFFEFGMLLLFGIAWIVKANIIPGLVDTSHNGRT